MAKFGAITDGFIQVAGVNLSADCFSFTPNFGTRAQRFDAHGDTWEYNTPGLLNGTITARFYHDFAATKAYALIKAVWLARGQISVIVQEESGARSTTRPGYSGIFMIETLTSPLGGEHGAIGMMDVTFNPMTNISELTT